MGRVLGGVTCTGGDKSDTLVHHELDDARVADERLGDVDAEGSVREITHLGDLDLHVVELTGTGFDDAHTPGIGYRRCQLGPGDPAHGGLHNWVVNPQQFGDACTDRCGSGSIGHPVSFAPDSVLAPIDVAPISTGATATAIPSARPSATMFGVWTQWV